MVATTGVVSSIVVYVITGAIGGVTLNFRWEI